MVWNRGDVTILTEKTDTVVRFTIAESEYRAELRTDGMLHWNDGDTWTDIYEYNNNGTSPFSARNQVIKYTGGGEDFETPDAFSYFRYYVTSIKSGVHHQINEIEFFSDSTNFF